MTKLTRAQVEKWRDDAKDYIGDPFLPACRVLDTADQVWQLCDALLDAWSDYHAHPAPEPPTNPEGK